MISYWQEIVFITGILFIGAPCTPCYSLLWQCVPCWCTLVSTDVVMKGLSVAFCFRFDIYW